MIRRLHTIFRELIYCVCSSYKILKFYNAEGKIYYNFVNTNLTIQRPTALYNFNIL